MGIRAARFRPPRCGGPDQGLCHGSGDLADRGLAAILPRSSFARSGGGASSDASAARPFSHRRLARPVSLHRCPVVARAQVR